MFNSASYDLKKTEGTVPHVKTSAWTAGGKQDRVLGAQNAEV